MHPEVFKRALLRCWIPHWLWCSFIASNQQYRQYIAIIKYIADQAY